MNQATIFRFLVVASIVMAILGAAVDHVVPGLLAPGIKEAHEAYMAAHKLTVARALAFGGFSLLVVIASIAATIGILRFRPWSRRLSLWLSVLSMPMYPFIGPIVSSGWANMLVDTSMMLWGAALGMAYFSEVTVRFERESATRA